MAWLEGDAEVQAELDPEDDALLLRAWQLRVGPLLGRGNIPLRYRHIAIDEVQDFSPVEVRVLIDCLDERRSLTLAGDTQQHVMQAAGFTSWPEFLAHLGLEGTSIDTLRVSYRSSREITSFSRELLGDLAEESEPPLSVRSGPPVECLQFTDPGACALRGCGPADLACAVVPLFEMAWTIESPPTKSAGAPTRNELTLSERNML